MSDYTYEESVKWMRSQPELAQTVKDCYLDENNLVAAQRFAQSEEFAAVKKLLRLDAAKKPLHLLDLGCGNGIASFAFAALGHNVVAVDPDESSDVGLCATNRLAAVSAKGTIETRKAFAESLPFEDNLFDVVYARQALHHFSDLEHGLKECARVLKKDGRMLATREHVVDNDEQLQEFFNNHILHKLHSGENAHTLEVYYNAFMRAGFNQIKVLAPFDTIINHFPASNAQVRELASTALKRRFGALPTSMLLKSQMLDRLVRRRLSAMCNTPGRLYSFLCTVDK